MSWQLRDEASYTIHVPDYLKGVKQECVTCNIKVKRTPLWTVRSLSSAANGVISRSVVCVTRSVIYDEAIEYMLNS